MRACEYDVTVCLRGSLLARPAAAAAAAAPAPAKHPMITRSKSRALKKADIYNTPSFEHHYLRLFDAYITTEECDTLPFRYLADHTISVGVVCGGKLVQIYPLDRTTTFDTIGEWVASYPTAASLFTTKERKVNIFIK